MRVVATGTPSRPPLHLQLRRPVTDIARACKRIGDLTKDGRRTRHNRQLLIELYREQILAAHAELTEFVKLLGDGDADTT